MNGEMKSTLESELTNVVSDCSKLAKRHYLYAQLAFAISVLASFLSSILTGIGTADLSKLVGANELIVKAILTLLTAVPATVLLVNNTIRFEERTKWFWNKTRKTEKLLRELKYSANTDVTRISTAFSSLSEELENQWPALGASPAQPKKPGT